MKIVPAHSDDISEFSEIEFANMAPLFADNPEWIISSVEAAIRENKERAWKLIGDELLGFYYWVPDEDCAVLLSIQVPQRHQSKGYGSRLLAHFHTEATAHQFTKLGLAVHTRNRAYQWYVKNGFVYHQHDGPDCHMLVKEVQL